MKIIKILLYTLPLLLFGNIIVHAAAPVGGYTPGATNNPDCAPGDANCFVSISLSNSWTLGGTAGGGSALGSNDSVLPFMSHGNTMMQLNTSNLSLSNNQSFVDAAGRNGVFIGNYNTYGNSDNVLAIGETLEILEGNKNIIALGNQVDRIENNQNSFFGGENISKISKNNNVFLFGNNNTLTDSSDSIFFGYKNDWVGENSKFIVGSNGKKWFQVDMDSGEMHIGGNIGNAGQYLASQGPGVAPIWQDFPVSGSINQLNGLSISAQIFATGSTGNDFTISSSASTHTFHIPNASITARGFISTGTQSFTGSKTFTQAPSISSFTLGSIPFISTGGLLSQNNTRLFWDNTNNQLLINGGTANFPSYSFIGDADTGMYRPANNSLRFAAGGNTIGRMDTAGWMLGDGGIPPVSLVHIGGGVNPTTFRMTNNLSGNTASDGFFVNYSTGSIISLSNLENADMTFGTNNTERMRILANGNIAISQTGATEKLEVNGGIKISNSVTICTIGSAGVIRYDTTTNKHQGCNGMSWNDLY